MKSFFKNFITKFMMFCVPVFALVLYDWQFLEENSHTGIVALDVDLWFYINYFIWVAVLAALYPTKILRPADVFPVFYIPIACLCGAVYWQNTGLLHGPDWLLMLGLLTSPIVALKITSKILFANFRLPVASVNLSSNKSLPLILLIIIATAAVTGYFINENVGGFDMEHSYDRRLAGRMAFADHTFARYLFDNAANGAVLILAFISGSRKSLIYLLWSMAFAFFNFWLLGTKATFFYVVLMFFIGKIYKNGNQEKLPVYFISIVTVLFIAATVECLANGRSIIADYIIRRAFMAAVQIQSYYIDSIFNGQGYPYTLLTGVGGDIVPSLFIGKTYFGNADTNANTNAIFYELAHAGLPGLLFCIVFICVFFGILDKNYKKTGSVNTMAVGCLYSMLLVEQAFTTALISSGVLLCLFLVLWKPCKIPSTWRMRPPAENAQAPVS